MRMIRDATSQRCHRLIGLRSNPVQSRPIPSNPRAIYNGSVTAQATERSQLLHRWRWQLGDRHISTPHTPRPDHAAVAPGRISPFSTAAPITRIAALHGALARSTSASPTTATVPDTAFPRFTPRYSPPALPASRPNRLAASRRPRGNRRHTSHLTPRHHCTWRCDPGRGARRAVGVSESTKGGRDAAQDRVRLTPTSADRARAASRRVGTTQGVALAF